MSKKNIYRVEYRPIHNRPIHNFSMNTKKGVIGEVSIEVRAYDIKEAMSVANQAVVFDDSDAHEISGVNLMFRPCIGCDEDGD